MKSFASDNWASVHKDVMEALAKANCDHQQAYQHDIYTDKVRGKFKELFSYDVEVYFASCGTAANILSLASMVKYADGVICADSAHINTDEAGAFERFTGCKLLQVPNYDNGKLRPSDMDIYTREIGNFHRVQPKVVSISQSTERENVYTADEIREISKYAKAHNMYLHVDGARCANAVVALKSTMKEMFTDTGVDVLSFGGTKNGVMYGEAIIFFNKELAKGFEYILKQSMQYLSKSRYIAVQFDALLSNDLWVKNASHANNMAQYFESKLKDLKDIEITMKAVTNAMYVKIPTDKVLKLQTKFPFYNWTKDEYRLMTSFDTTKEDIDEFIKIMIDI
ncbi:MAG: Low specificity L-threonine aldolase [Alphaproteobacteria bacterium ADurb.Bin438]|nr:MAG: Low specificity L-threonine aldolase [Alphaproteobacteria bacterium ADurb.Bin438]